MTSFVGRQHELDQVRRLLGTHRLVTLTGIGGTGKTRVALRAAAQSRRAFPDGVWFVDLTQWRDQTSAGSVAPDVDMLAFAVANALALRGQGSLASVEALAEHLAGWRALLVLDNCEHLLPASGRLAAALLEACPELRVLATSREPLLAGEEETVFSVPPLRLPPLPVDEPASAELPPSEAVALFLDRGRAVVPGLTLTSENQLAVVEICHRLDGLPLAIELAAAWLVALGPQQIRDRLSDTLSLLRRASRLTPSRQQTLRACVDWSFQLCSKPERLLWARASVFVGGFQVDAVGAVCADEDLPSDEVGQVLADLADKSILSRDDRGDQVRYRMLETLRDYGREQLEQFPEPDAWHRRHRNFYQDLVVRARADWISSRQVAWMTRLTLEHPNLRAAVEYCLADPQEAARATALVVALPDYYWWALGLFEEGRRWLEQALSLTREPTPGTARALLMAGHWAMAQGDVEAGLALFTEGEELATRLDDAGTLALAAFVQGVGLMFADQLELSTQTFRGALATLTRGGDPDEDLRLNTLHCLAISAAALGDHDLAASCHREMLERTEPAGEVFYRFAAALWGAGLAAYLRGDLTASADHLTQALGFNRSAGLDDRYSPAMCLEVLSWVAVEQGRYTRGATLLAAASEVWQDLGSPITGLRHLVRYHQAAERRARQELRDIEYEQAVAAGQGLSCDEAIAFALEEPQSPHPTDLERVDPLTPRERQVADLIARGLPNRQIAIELQVSVRTAEGHVARLLTKLGLDNRTQLGSWVRAHPPHPGA
ncbi:MAG TPA: LuxR C-terminal-related transcriptional regulator [Kineosporiaceae bacterium]